MTKILKLAVLSMTWIVLIFGCSSMNDYKQTGQLSLSGLKAPVTVLRDERGVAYIRATNTSDVLMSQGFVTAQDRLFQMELNRRFAAGRISEFAGEKALALDTRMRTIGLYRAAQKHARILDATTLAFFQRYADGVNAYIRTRKETLPLEFKLAGITPEPWSAVDSLAIMYIMAWNTSANVRTEISMQMLVEALGPEKAQALFPLNINPDEPEETLSATGTGMRAPVATGIRYDARSLAWLNSSVLGLGSNNWVTGPAKSKSGLPIVANDPHLDTRILPGPWYPVGLVTPEIRVVGVNIAGIPGISVGRTAHLAFGSTNAYSDMQDLYVETVDPGKPSNYLEGNTSIPFGIIKEDIRFKDKKAPGGFGIKKIQIRNTRRGPVVSGILKHLSTSKVLSLRFAPFETMNAKVGFDRFLTATSVDQAIAALRQINMISLNFVMADTSGNIAWWVTGKLPNRTGGGGTVPFVVTDGKDNWNGWIPFEKKPHAVNPDKGWIGTCNHATITHETDYYYSSYFSPHFDIAG